RTYGEGVTPALMKSAYNKASKEIKQAKIDMTGVIDGDMIEVSSTSTFAINDDNSDYRVGYAVLENNVGPYSQKNYYAGGGSGEMGGYENMESSVMQIYNDVVRLYYGCDGIPESLPSSVKKGESYVHSCSIPMTNIKKPENLSVVALLINATNGSIVNAVKISDLSIKNAGIDETILEMPVTVSGRTISVPEEGSLTRVYYPDGRLVITIAPGDSAYLLPGLYITTTKHITSKILLR
ncbi:MAG: hypothetical protein K2H75_06500, partial [Muribaculaceae bacterium]|nr:hypothetical protein [Muribaculaceae bacterium]